MLNGIAISVCLRAVFSTATDWGPCASPNGNAYDPRILTTTAAYDQRDGARLHWFNNAFWLLGGWWPTSPPWGPEVTTNEVWSSPDCITWTKQLSHDATPPTSGAGARWRPRHTFMSTVFDGYLWVLGSDHLDASGWLADVWRSADGTTWERVLAEAPWKSQIPILAAFGGKLHVMGGYIDAGEVLNDSIASTQHWSSPDGVTWTQLAAMPFSRAGVNDAMVSCGKIIIAGGSTGTYATRTFPTDCWAFDGSSWHQQSATSGGIWAGRDWVSTAVYDGKLWILTGVNSVPTNFDGAYYSEDLGVTWVSVQEPWNASHADAVTVNADGIFMASGNLQVKRTYQLASEAGTGPYDLSLSRWLRAQYTASPWVDRASAGTSGGRSISEATNPPAQGTALVGVLTPASFDGTNDKFLDDQLFLDGYITASQWWVGLLVKVDTAAPPAVAAYDDEAIISDNNGGWLVAITTLGVRAVNYDGAYKTTAHVLLLPDVWAWVEAWLVGGTLSIAVNGGTPATVASGNLTSLGVRAMRFGCNYDTSKLFDGQIAEAMVSATVPTDRAALRTYVNARYGLSL